MITPVTKNAKLRVANVAVATKKSGALSLSVSPVIFAAFAEMQRPVSAKDTWKISPGLHW
jgi:hypothetical protein